jgi:hypothetical protein
MKQRPFTCYHENRLLFYCSKETLLPCLQNLKPVVFSTKYLQLVGMKSIWEFKRSYDLLASRLKKKVYIDQIDDFLVFEIC